MQQNPFTVKNAVNASCKHYCDGTHGDEKAVAFLVEEAHFGELVGELSVVLGHLGDRVVLQVEAVEEFVEELEGDAAVEGDECVGGVLAGEV